MTEDRVHPSAKPLNGTTAAVASAPPPPPGGATTKPHQLYNPATRLPYRPQPHHRRYSRRRCRCSCCCCFIWTTITILIIILLMSIIACALYVLYRPHKPSFTISSLRTRTLNVTTSPDASSSHLACLFNVTITCKNPNNHIKLSYEPANVVALSHGGVELGNGTLSGLGMMSENNATSLRVIVGSSKGLDAESATNLKEEMTKKKNGMSIKILMDTKVQVKVGKFDSKRVGIRVSCDGIKGVVMPKSKKVASVADVKDVKCKVDLRIKIWKFTF